MLKLSIIIPVFNVEKYIEKCIISCCTQNIPKNEYEIIIINDGSTDNSLNILNHLSLEIPNITIFSQINKGLSAARNQGLLIAKGEYVWFIDSDDWIIHNCLKTVCELCYNNKLDVLAINAANAPSDNSLKRIRLNNCNSNIIDGKKYLLENNIQLCAPFYIIKRSLLIEKNLLFFEGILHEDIEYTPRLLYYTDRLLFLDKILYFVYQNPNSITRSINPKKSFDLIIVCSKLSEFSDKIEIRYKIKISNIISTAINNALFNSYKMDKSTIYLLNNVLYENKKIFYHLISSSLIKYKIEGILFLMIPKQYTKIYSLMRLFIKNN